MEFGICFKGFVQPDRARYLVRQAEEAGFSYCWFYDSHILWRESFMAIAMCMEHTKTMRFGPCVTKQGVAPAQSNPGLRYVSGKGVSVSGRVMLESYCMPDILGCF